jgi:hypothetical protein
MPMDATTLIEIATDRAAWMRKSVELRHAADVLWDHFRTEAEDWARLQSHRREDADLAWARAMGNLTIAKMLYGLALETAFKATILRQRPADVTFELKADGSGRVIEAVLKGFGPSMPLNHDLLRLAEATNVLSEGSNAIFADPDDIRTVRKILSDLGDFVLWIGRYPIPRKAGDTTAGSPGHSSPAAGDDMRRWTDRILDYFHGRDSGGA